MEQKEGAANQIRKVIAGLGKKKEPTLQQESETVTKAVTVVVNKMNNSRIQTLKPPYFPKTLSKYRMEAYLPLKKIIQPLLTSKDQQIFSHGLFLLNSFIGQLDHQHFDAFLQQLRGNYSRKIEQQNYEIDIDLKQLSLKYKLRTQKDILLNAASQWLVQIQVTQDILQRIQLYFGVHAPWIIEKTTKEGNDAKQGTWLTKIMNSISKLYSLGLRKASKLFQTTVVSTIAPTAALMTIAVIGTSGSSALLPFQDLNKLKALFAPLLAVAVPYVLDGLADSVDRRVLTSALANWSNTFELLADSIRKFNMQLQNSIELCCNAASILQYTKERTNIEKFIALLRTNYHNLNTFDEEKFDEMRERTQAYYRPYHEVEEEGWIVVTPAEIGQENVTLLEQQPVAQTMLKGFMKVAKTFNKLETIQQIQMELKKQCLGANFNINK